MTIIIPNKRARDMIAARLQSVANQTCQEDIKLQEHQITSRIGKALELELRRRNILGHRIRVITHDLPDKGRRSLEKPIGADLYVGFELVGGGESRSKGILVQAKKAKSMDAGQVKRLKGQCRDMLGKTDAAYVWTYSENGIISQEAESFDRLGPLARRTGPADVFASILECTKGDPKLGLPPTSDVAEAREQLHGKLKDLAVGTGIFALLERPDHPTQRRL